MEYHGNREISRPEFQRTLTRRMNSVSEGLKELNLITRDDFRRKIRELELCDEDEKATVLGEIRRMFKAFGVTEIRDDPTADDLKALLLNTPGIPTREQLSGSVYDKLADLYMRNPFPSPEEYIARIARDRIDPAWQQDPLRLQLLKSFLRAWDGLQAAGCTLAYPAEYVAEKTGIRKPSAEDILLHIDDGIFDRAAAEKEGFLREQRELQEKKKLAPTAEEKKNLNRLIEAADGRMRGKFRNIRSAAGLLKLSEDLASGRFGNDETVREEIYIFAAVFGLTYRTEGAGGWGGGSAADIEDAMFRDYYSNNYLRYVSGRNPGMRNGGEIQNPTGKGINYKNYMEVIFLYYLRRDLPAAEKLARVYRTAAEVHEAYTDGAGPGPAGGPVPPTLKYRDDVRIPVPGDSRSVLLLDEEPFKAWLVRNCDCSLAPKSSQVFSIRSEQQTAVSMYKKLWDYREAARQEELPSGGNPDADGQPQADTGSDCWGLSCFEPRIRSAGAAVKSVEAGETCVDTLDERTKFDIILYEIDRDLKDVRKPEAFLKTGKVSRSDFMKLYYQCFMDRLGEDDDPSGKIFSVLWDNFCDGVNQYLVPALFLPVDGRNLYDLVLVYSAYCLSNDLDLDSDF